MKPVFAIVCVWQGAIEDNHLEGFATFGGAKAYLIDQLRGYEDDFGADNTEPIAMIEKTDRPGFMCRVDSETAYYIMEVK